MQDEWKDQKQDQWIREELKKEAERIEQETKDVILEEKPGDREALFGKILESVRQEEKRTGKVLLTSEKENPTISEEKETETTGFAVVHLSPRNMPDDALADRSGKKGVQSGGRSGKTAGKRRRFAVLKAASVLLVACVGVFGITMTSEGNRLWVMEKVEQVFGSGENVRANNDEDRKFSDVSELEAREMIEEELGIPVPEFFYLPEGTEFWKAEIDEVAGDAVFLYTLADGSVLSLRMFSSKEDKTQSMIYDGEFIYENQYTVDNIIYYVSVRLDDMIKEELTDIKWNYKNYSFELSGNINRKEIETIVRGIRH